MDRTAMEAAKRAKLLKITDVLEAVVPDGE